VLIITITMAITRTATTAIKIPGFIFKLLINY
jgi:hypothetical protein